MKNLRAHELRELSEAPFAAGPVALYFRHLVWGGGAERAMCLLVGALRKRGFAVHLITCDEPDAHCSYALNSRIAWTRLGFCPGTMDKLRRVRALARLLRDDHIRVLVGLVMNGDKTAYAAAKLAGVRLVAAERSAPSMYYLRCGFAQRLLSFSMLHLANRITVQMPEFVAGYPASLRSRIEVIPNSVPVAVRHARPNQPGFDGRFNLLAVGRLESVKCYNCLIRAFARIAAGHPAWHLRILGDGTKREALRGIAVETGVGERVHFEPWRSDPSNAYATSHLFALPSLWEGFSNALTEAMSHGLPAIGFRDAAGVAQLIANGESGWLAEGLNDEAALARTLSVAMADGAERARRGACAAKSMAAYDPETQFDRWARLLGELMDLT